MRFDLNEDQEMLRDAARRFLEAECALARVRQMEGEEHGFTRTWWKDVSGMGWTSLMAPEAFGGVSLSGNAAQDTAIVAEELGRAVAPGPFLPTVLALDAIVQSDVTKVHKDLVPRILAGEVVAAWAFAEAGNRWDPATFETSLESVGADLVLRGSKWYVEAGAEADALVVTARSATGLSQVIVPADAKGITVVAGRSLDLARRFAQVRFEDVRLPAEALLGELGSATGRVVRQRQLAVVLQCAETNGAVERAYEFTIDYMRERFAFGRPIASYQALKHRLADMLLWIHSSMATTDAALDAFDRGAADAGRLASIAKAYVAKKATEIMCDLTQLTGGIAVTWEHDLHLFKRRVAVNRAVLGTPEQHRRCVYATLQERETA
jgi:alkylation response protein AidB-like acyl-CoA dehydrogenase